MSLNNKYFMIDYSYDLMDDNEFYLEVHNHGIKSLEEITDIAKENDLQFCSDGFTFCFGKEKRFLVYRNFLVDSEEFSKKEEYERYCFYFIQSYGTLLPKLIIYKEYFLLDPFKFYEGRSDLILLELIKHNFIVDISKFDVKIADINGYCFCLVYNDSDCAFGAIGFRL